MKVTIDWLKKYVDFPQSPQELAQRLTTVGLEVGNVTETQFQFDGIVIGQIEAIQSHPTQETLTICRVNLGQEKLDLVCGAPNVAVGLKVPVAKIGSRLPENQTVKSARIHGVESPGMICSEAELGLSHQADIVMELPAGAPIGSSLKEFLGHGETVLDIDLTTNRPDCLGVIGVAREIGAINGVPIHKPPLQLHESAGLNISDVIEIEVKHPSSCPRYTARYIDGITVGPSPRWLIEKLEAVGLRTINNVVDVTNFVMMETGQPLHAFDYDLLAGQKIVVRHARTGEKFVTLDGKEHTLSDQTLLICDAEKPVALAGVMGGLNSEITAATRRVLLESAYFAPSNIRKTSKTLGITTDSSQRFERGVDINGLRYALDRAAQLIAELAGGAIATGVVDRYPQPVPPRTISLRVQRVQHLLGALIPTAEIEAILRRLEFKVQRNDDLLTVEVPTFRVDIEREVDLIEEVVRLYGFDRIQENRLSTIPLLTAENRREKFNNLLREIMTGLGYHEVITLSLLNHKWAQPFSPASCVQIKNPISEDLDTLRPSLVPGLLSTVKWNKNRLVNDQKLFEIGNIFYWDQPAQSRHCEQARIGLVLIGQNRFNHWLEKPRGATFYDLKGDVFSFLEKLKFTKCALERSQRAFLDNRSLEIVLNNASIGFVGALSQEILARLDVKNDIFVAELDYEALWQGYEWDRKFQPIPKYPPIKRDLALLIDLEYPVAVVEQAIWEAGANYLKSVQLFDFYRGQQVAAGKKSLAFSLTFYSLDRTLTEREVDADISQILEFLKSRLMAQLRE
ncbi:MAG: phenylalanine--tRNA ligase subunit beta [candidate division KSB1 bacterium]|nr:phenylalanine--tRNA ligase subunit beta [candidate division KSB1 bacterium]MDZ7341113.1 phenylalanine--tRNA ligase subunit beta [candidate division KSB1 bacterium]